VAEVGTLSRFEHARQLNDSYRYFEAAGFLYRCGPTNTNVCDIQVLVVRG